MAEESAYVSRVRIERLGGPQRLAHLPAEEEPVAFGVHSEVAEHYGVTPEQYPPHATTRNHVGEGGRGAAGRVGLLLPGRCTSTSGDTDRSRWVRMVLPCSRVVCSA